ncbi:SCO family protein [Pelomonas sp. SE-A7]|uniref:SCO family protein n=1 Tax=Pelomonas sp. SE-A7 TaxID=3054953 RepID=UPI00259D1161|nr:SCO family protein [Pelomonas sp. SE-A7]MDM4764613.1 SCO family protein [Pelomonas sp. SE-A7]
MTIMRALAGLALCLASLTLVAAPALKAGVFDPPHAAPEFSLSGSDGQELRLSRYRGKLVLLVFGFTNCPEVCPTTLATLAQARKSLGAKAASVQVVYVTVDPERDDLARIRQYLGAFDASFVGGTGKPAVLESLRRDYGVMATKVGQSAGGYGMNHSTSVYLIDREGRLRALMPYGRKAADFVHDLQLLLAAK